MSIAVVFRIFKNSSLYHGTGEIQNQPGISQRQSRKKSRIHLFDSDNGTIIYARHTARGKTSYAVIGD
jgi:hypothetical protein